jgi:hypothetical protein
VQVLFSAMLVNAFHPALEHGWKSACNMGPPDPVIGVQ